MSKKYPQHRTPPSVARENAFKYGKDFEQTFKDTFPGGIAVNEKCGYNFGDYPIYTSTLLAHNDSITIFEAGFVHKQTLVLTDVLFKENEDSIHIYEVKNMDKMSNVVWKDMAIQYYVCKNAIPQLKSFSFVLRGKYRPFRIVEVTKYLEKRIENIESKIDELIATLNIPYIPDIKTGPHCHHPYECDFKAFCTLQEQVEAGKLF